MARYDCFPFFNELEILEIRLHELHRDVDTFVLVEAPWTHQGNPKPLFFDENKRRFKRFLPQIRHVVVPDHPKTDDPWVRERYQRECIRLGLADVRSGDLVIVSDADEIVRREVIVTAEGRNEFCFLRMQLYRFYLDLFESPWLKAYSAPFSYINSMKDLSEPRWLEDRYLDTTGLDRKTNIVDDAGWHFSTMGGVPKILSKIDAFAHTEESVQRWRNVADLQSLIAARRASSGVLLKTLPRLIRRHPNRYHRKGLLAQDPPSLLRRLFGEQCRLRQVILNVRHHGGEGI